jgi:NADH-quinone oxidoreductase subunit C
MNTKLEKVIQAARSEFACAVEEFRGEAHLIVDPERIVAVITWLRDVQDFPLLSAMTAVDYWPKMDPRFHVIYQLTSLSKNLSVQVRAPVPGARPVMSTVSGVFANANWREREIWDMFGIHFDGHPDPRRILMPQDWEGHPLRKDYPLGYEEPQFTFNFEEIDLRKPYAKE